MFSRGRVVYRLKPKCINDSSVKIFVELKIIASYANHPSVFGYNQSKYTYAPKDFLPKRSFSPTSFLNLMNMVAVHNK